MALKNFTKMEYGSADEVVFGDAKSTLQKIVSEMKTL